MLITWSRTVQPSIDPITLTEAKAQARLTHGDEDPLLLSFVRTATDEAERYLGYGLLTQTIRLAGDEWPSRIWLPQALVLQSVTSVEYYDTAGTLQTLGTSQYIVDDTTRPASIVPAVATVWPTLQVGRDAWRWRVTYVVGWSKRTDIPPSIRHGIKLLVTHLDANRDGTEGDMSTALRNAQNCWYDRIKDVPPYRCEDE